MKKKTLRSTLALMLALTMVLGSTMTTFAADDGCYRPENPNDDDGNYVIDLGGGGSSDSGSSSSGGGSSSNSGSGSSSNSSGGGGSYDSGSSYDAGGSYDAGSGSSGTSYSAPAPKAAGTKVTAGKQEFNALAKPANGTYKVSHKGSEVATFRLMDAEKKSVPCTKVSLKQRDDDKKWAIDFEVDDAKGLTIGAPLDRTYMYDILDVSYVSINDSIIIDIESEAAAAKAAK